MSDRQWMPAKEACAYLEISFPTLKRYIADGKLQASQVVPNGMIRVSRASAEKLFRPTPQVSPQ